MADWLQIGDIGPANGFSTSELLTFEFNLPRRLTDKNYANISTFHKTVEVIHSLFECGAFMTGVMIYYRFFVFLFLIIAVCVGPRIVSAFEHPGGLHTRPQLDFTRQKVLAGEQPWTSEWSKLLQNAKGRLTEKPSAVKDYWVPGYYDDSTAHQEAKKILLRDTEAAYTAAIVYALGVGLSKSERNRYADKVVDLLNNWASVNKSFSGFDGALVMSYTAIGMVHAAELTWDYPGWSSQDKSQFQTWAKSVLYKAANIKTRRLSTLRPTNWNNWGILLALSIDHLTDDKTGLNADIEILKQLIDVQIDKDGRLPEEIKRRKDSIHYTAFALEPLTAAIEVARNAGGPDLFAWKPPSGGTVEDALHFLFDKGIKNPSAWPVSGATSGESRSEETFEAMGRVYGEDKWTSWANPPVPDLGTGLGFVMPTLFHLRPLGEEQLILTLTPPANLQLLFVK